jgi:hypothetical protein
VISKKKKKKKFCFANYSVIRDATLAWFCAGGSQMGAKIQKPNHF